jgi:hypothetical protein
MKKKIEAPFPESNIKPKLQRDWVLIMDHLNAALLKILGSKNVKNEENMIIIEKWKIYTTFVNTGI